MKGDPSKDDADHIEVRTRAELREAYEMGRRDERAARKRHPLLMTLTVLAAVVGVALLGLAAANGSFTQAGGVVDKNLAVAATQAEPQVRSAADQANQSLKEAGRTIRDRADDRAGDKAADTAG